ncbi:MAG TPA: DivIVA domain-containing protein [Thermoleophilia bacterium]|nr:DivIVA domain-containing protein [Thermoleophilia bacterium]HQG54057.1 DivIVA domain-containing protein [Thermoleophilia bacterium]
MKLTPLDIRHKEFKRVMRGYADVEVDEFLDDVADEFERLFKENIDLTERVEGLDEKVGQYRRIEETLQKTLVSAQQSAEELKANATKESQLILRDAELKARQMVSDLYTERQNLEKQIQALRGVEQDLRLRLRTMLQSFLKQLEEAPVVVADASVVDDFADRARAIKEAIAREDTVVVPAGAAPSAEPEPAAPAEPEPAAPEEDEATRLATVAGDAGDAGAGRLVVGDDDLLADVDAGVNEDEFKW